MSQHEMAFETNFTWKKVYASGFDWIAKSGY